MSQVAHGVGEEGGVVLDELGLCPDKEDRRCAVAFRQGASHGRLDLARCVAERLRLCHRDSQQIRQGVLTTDRLRLGSRRELGDDHALAGETDDEPFFFEGGVSAADGHRGNAEVPCRLPDRRQMLPCGQAPHADVMNHLVFDLEIDRQTARAVDRQSHSVPHDLTQAVLVHYHSCRF